MLIPLLKKLVAADSQIRGSNARVASFLAQTFRRLGGKVAMTSYVSDGVRRWNVRADWGQRLPGRPLIFSGHTDTANVHGAWKTDPLRASVRGTHFFGLGISDMKGSIAAFTAAFADAREELQRPVTVLLDGDEEGYAVGGKLLTKKRPTRPATIIVGEATGNAIRLGQKACFDATVTTYGIGKHASRVRYLSNQRENAILKLHDVLTRLRVCERQLDKRRHAIFGRSTLSYGLIQGGVGVNTVAPEARLSVNRRLVPQERMLAEQSALRALVRAVDPTADVAFPFSGDGFFVARSTAWVRALLSEIRKATGVAATTLYAPGWTEASLFTRWGRVFVLGPGDMTTIHQANERVQRSALERGRVLYRTILANPNL